MDRIGGVDEKSDSCPCYGLKLIYQKWLKSKKHNLKKIFLKLMYKVGQSDQIAKNAAELNEKIPSWDSQVMEAFK